MKEILDIAIEENWHTLPKDSPEYKVFALCRPKPPVAKPVEKKEEDIPKLKEPKKAKKAVKKPAKKVAKKPTTKKKGK